MGIAVTQYENPINEAVELATVDPDWFAREILLMPNDKFQSELLNAVADLDRIRLGLPTLYNHEGLNRFTVRSCHGTGKTHAIAKLMHWFNFTRMGLIACTAPKEKQVITRVWPEFRKVLTRAMASYKQLIHVDKTKITWAGNIDWTALVEAASQSENLGGLHHENMLFLVEEASGVDNVMFPAIEGSLSTFGAIMVMIGNPTRVEGEFYDSHRKVGTTELYYKMHVKPEDSPRVDPRYIETMKTKYGEKSPIYIVRCLGDFAEMVANQLFAMGWIDDARNKEYKSDGSLPTKRMSIDVGDGSDESVITLATHYDSFIYYKKQYMFSFPPAESPVLLAEAAEELAERFDMKWERGDDIVVDSLGPGSGTAGILIQLGFPVIIYKGGEGSDDSTQWLNRRTQSYISMRDHFRDKKVIFAEDFFEDPDDWDHLTAELVMIKTNPGIERVEALEPKRKLAFSPNKADSLAMQHATQQPTLGSTDFDPEVLGSTQMSDYDAELT